MGRGKEKPAKDYSGLGNSFMGNSRSPPSGCRKAGAGLRQRVFEERIGADVGSERGRAPKQGGSRGGDLLLKGCVAIVSRR